MTDTEVIERAATGARDHRARMLLLVFAGLFLAGLAAVAIAFFSYRSTTSDRIDSLEGQAATNAADARALYDQVERLGGEPVVDPPPTDDPDPDDADPDDPERQDPEIQDPEQQDGEQQDPEVQDPELADVEVDDPDPDDPEIQDEEIQDPEIDDPPVPGPAGPTCPPGYTATSRVYDPSPVPGDEETWWVCVADGQGS